MRIAIYGQQLAKENAEHVRDLFRGIGNYNVTVLIFRSFKEHLKKHHKIDLDLPTFDTTDDLKDVDCLLSLGGDGTMLSTILLIKDSGIPVVGLNMGRLGFLSSIPKENADNALRNIMEKRYTLDQRVMISINEDLEKTAGENFAMNEVTVLKKDVSSMIRIHTWLDDEFFNTYWADGLIISTPTGSTGYSLSCGGPIILPECESFVITPIAPHNLNMRPVIIPDRTTIRLTVEGRSKTFLLSLDSRSYTLSKHVELIMKKCDFTINLVKLPNTSTITTMRNKLLWGIDKRN